MICTGNHQGGNTPGSDNCTNHKNGRAIGKDKFSEFVISGRIHNVDLLVSLEEIEKGNMILFSHLLIYGIHRSNHYKKIGTGRWGSVNVNDNTTGEKTLEKQPFLIVFKPD
jgi:hypothetical protein